MSTTAFERRLNRAAMVTMLKVPFFGPGLLKLPVVEDRTVPTWCTDGKCVRANPDWSGKLPDEVLPTIYCHEVMHCLLGHLWRFPAGGDPEVWNQATDHVVNLTLKEFSAGVMAKGLADPFPFPTPESAYCADPRFAGMGEEKVYSILLAEKVKSGGGGKKPGKGQPGQGSGQPAPHSMPVFGQMQMPEPGQVKSGAQQKSQTDWAATAIQSAKAAKGHGAVPSALDRFVDGIVNPQVPWWELMRSFLREQCSDDWNWAEPAMEYSGSGFILPSLKSDKVGRVVFATDTSGSIDAECLARFQAEKQACLDDMRPRCLVDIYCDADIHKVSEYGPGDTIAKDAPGGGGTDFRPVFALCDKMDERPRCLVYLTDLYGSFPEVAPDYPVLWVTWRKGGQAPFGEVVYAES